LDVVGDIINGIAFGGLLFVLASGFSLALGVIGVMNIAHGAFYILAVYLGISVAEAAGGFPGAVLIDSATMAVIAALAYRLLLRRFQLAPLPQVLSMYGLTLIIAQAVRLVWGGYPQVMHIPAVLDGTVQVLGTIVPMYRAFLLVVAIVLWFGLWLLIERTSIGALVRAAVDDGEIARSIGIDIERLSMILFGFAGLLVGFGGALGAPLLGGYQGVEFEILTLTLVVVVLGGVGSLHGAFVSSLLVGILWNVGIARFAQYSYFVLFAPMILVLSLRPRGLLGRKLAIGE
jgi:branched-chain amino acid transport system permease protein